MAEKLTDALGNAGVWHNIECEAQTYGEAIEILARERDEWRDAAGRQTAQVVALQMECEEARKRAEAAEQREVQLRNALMKVWAWCVDSEVPATAEDVLGDDWQRLRNAEDYEMGNIWREIISKALADVPAAPAAQPHPAPAKLDPALREPIADDNPAWMDDANGTANARIAELWRWIDSEPERTKAAVADKLREVRNLFRSTHLNMAAARVCNDLADELAPPQQGGTAEVPRG